MTRRCLRKVGLDLSIARGKNLKFVRGSAFEIHIEERMHTIRGDHKSALLFEGSESAERSQSRDQDWALGEHLVAEGEMICAFDHDPPALPGGQLAVDRFH